MLSSNSIIRMQKAQQFHTPDGENGAGADAAKFIGATGDDSVHGGCAAVNRGADFVKPLALAPCARTRSLTGHRTPINQTASA
ncbi:MAG TPA: hypothetical protein DDX92_04800 [Flavobacteriales bacterium]|nr:hypothetical protein [Flavobacteriales bacterium]